MIFKYKPNITSCMMEINSGLTKKERILVVIILNILNKVITQNK